MQFERNEVWELIPRPESVNVIYTEWIFKNKLDEHGHVTQNKACLVAQGYTQVKGVNFDKILLRLPVLKLSYYCYVSCAILIPNCTKWM